MHAIDALGVPRLGLLKRPEEHLVAAEGVGAIALHQVVGVLHVELRFGHLLHLVTAPILSRFVEHEFRIGKLRAPRLEALEVEDIVAHQADVHVQALGPVLFAPLEGDEPIPIGPNPIESNPRKSNPI